MSDLEDDFEFGCPYCMASNLLPVDRTGGKHQVFVVDCETCCKPIRVRVDVEPDGYVAFDVKQEDE